MTFKVGQKVKIIKAHPTSSMGVHKHQEETVTIKGYVPWCNAYAVD